MTPQSHQHPRNEREMHSPEHDRGLEILNEDTKHRGHPPWARAAIIVGECDDRAEVAATQVFLALLIPRNFERTTRRRESGGIARTAATVTSFLLWSTTTRSKSLPSRSTALAASAACGPRFLVGITTAIGLTDCASSHEGSHRARLRANVGSSMAQRGSPSGCPLS
jgi:hypothetical protein